MLIQQVLTYHKNVLKYDTEVDTKGGCSLKKKIDMEAAGKRLRELRGIRTRTGVAKEVGIPYSTLQSYEEGKREPSQNIKIKLAGYYGVPVEYIFI